MKSRLLTILFLISVLFLTPSFTTQAASTGLTIKPIKISQTIEPGKSSSGFITLTNASGADVNVEISVEDFIPTAGTTNISFVSRAEGNTTVRDWITIDYEPSFIFAKDGLIKIPYTITAPTNAEPGGHFGVIFFKATEINSDSQLKIGTRVGVLTFVTVPGNQLQKGEIVDFTAPLFVQGQTVPFSILFKNTGTVHFEPKGEISILNTFGKSVGKVEVSGQAVLPTGERKIEVSWDRDQLLWGRYTASVLLVDGEGNNLSSENIAFYAFPLKYALIFIGTLILVFIILKFVKKRVNISVTITK